MFTGLIDHQGTITHLEALSSGIRLGIQHAFKDLELGESIAVDGCCLTVLSDNNGVFHCDVSPETCKLTTLKTYQIGQVVNLERALLPTTRMGGHFVTGHIDQTAQVKTIQKQGDFIEMIVTGFKNEKALLKKGSIAINGVSLTINEVKQNEISLMLIPLTLEKTNLKNLREKEFVNIEFDLLTRMIAKQIENVTP